MNSFFLFLQNNLTITSMTLEFSSLFCLFVFVFGVLESVSSRISKKKNPRQDYVESRFVEDIWRVEFLVKGFFL